MPTTEDSVSISEDDALHAYARMFNVLEPAEFLALLADDFVYTSHWVFQDITSAAEFGAYIGPKLEAVRASGAKAYAELGRVHDPFRGEERSCVIMAQGSPDKLLALAFAHVRDDCIASISLQIIPGVGTARRTGVYPS